MPLGATSGTITTAFDPITSSELEVMGRMNFVAPSAGCLSIIESSFPGATHVINVALEATPIIEENRGQICVGLGGINACDPVIPVESSSWGAIKSQYR
jgi:hypothetical protein